MQLNDIIEENTLPTISRKTRISIENLQALIDRDWSRLQKVQALGFISILEREYHADLGKLKEECRAYYAEHALEREPEAMVVAPVEKERTGLLYRTLLVLILLILAYGGWKYMAAPSEKSDVASTAEPQSGFFDSVLSMTKGWLGGEKPAVATPVAAQDAESGVEGPTPAAVSEGAWAEKNDSERNGSQSGGANRSSAETLTIAKVESAEKPKIGKSDEAQEAQIITQVKQEQAKAEALRQERAPAPAGAGEANLSDVSRMIVAATAGTAGEQGASEQEATSAPVPAEQGGAPEKQAGERLPVAKAPEASLEPAEEKALEIPEPKAKQPAAVTDTLVVFHPRSKVWVGYTELRSMKRTAKVATGDITFDTSKGDYILATGHGQLEFKGQNALKLNDGKRHFFMIAKGKVREISHEEFQRLNKSKVW